MAPPGTLPATRGREGLGAGSAGRLAHWLVLGVLSLLAAVLTWPTWAYIPQPGTDESWQFGLSWAASLGLQWGPDVAFTYGPLGYTLAPMLMPPSQVVIAGLVYVLAAAVTVASFHALLSDRGDLRPWLTLLLSVLAAVVVLIAGVGTTGLGNGGRMSAMVVAGVPLALVILETRSRWPIVASAVVVGIVGHQKLSEAVLVAGLIVIAALARRDRRDLPLFLLLALGVWFAIWLALGQDPAHLPSYVASAIAIVSGYASAMAIERPGFEWSYVPAAALCLLLMVQARESTRDRATVRLAFLLAAVGWYLWICFRQGYVRHDIHDVFFFAAVIVMSISLMATARRGSAIGLGILTCAVAVLVLSIHLIGFVGLLDRGDSIAAVSRALTAVTDVQARDAAWRAALQGSADAYGLPASLIEEMGTLPTTVDPGDVSALAATRVTWDPVPVLQLYAAYTPELDELNARSIERRPRQILRASPPTGFDDRFAYWESPRYQAAVYCRYDPFLVTDRWLLLRPAAFDRCSEPHDRLTVSATPGVPVDVPAHSGAITLASVTYHQSMVDVLANLVFKGPERFITYGTGTWRMPYVPHARDLMLNAPVPHAGFPGLPVTPYPNLVLDAPATVEFSFVDVSDAGRP